MRLTIELAMDNEAFSEDPHLEAARILKSAADRLLGSDYKPEFNLRDINGNTVGKLIVHDPEW